jgi:hypothetical protein
LLEEFLHLKTFRVFREITCGAYGPPSGVDVPADRPYRYKAIITSSIPILMQR